MQANYNWEYCNKVLKKPLENKETIVNSNIISNTNKPLISGSDRIKTYNTFQDNNKTKIV
jgi:hypothetical protein